MPPRIPPELVLASPVQGPVPVTWAVKPKGARILRMPGEIEVEEWTCPAELIDHSLDECRFVPDGATKVVS
jgi:hypothetical protein